MADPQSPLSGGLRVARRTVSADVFTGRSTVSEPDPVTTSLISRNSLALGTVSNQLQSISQQMNALNGSIQAVFTNISTNSALERQKDIQDQNQERILAEQRLREGQESIVERKIQSALISPVQRVAQKASFTLTRLMGFFTTLLAGWLLNQGIQTLKAFSEGNTKQLNAIKDNVLKNLGIVAGVYAAIRFGLLGTLNIITRLVSRIFAAVASKLFLRPVQALLSGVKGAAAWFISNFKKVIPGMSKAAAGGAAAGGAAAGGARAASSGLGMTFKTLTGTAVGAGVDVALTGEKPERAVAGAAGGSALSTVAGAIGRRAFGLPGALVLGIGGYMIGSDLGKGALDAIRGVKPQQNAPGPKPAKTQAPASTPSPEPTTPKVDSLTFMPLPSSEVEGSAKQGMGEQDFAKAPEYGRVEANVQPGLEGKSTEAAKTQEAQITPLKTETTQTKVQGMGPVPEPPPIAIPLPSQQQKSSKQVSVSGGAANNVPTFATSNPDNFYTLYSQVHYNVVAI
jgi:hypothetical protein